MSLFDLGPATSPRAPDIQYIKGGFQLGKTSVPFFSASLRADHLASLFCLPSQIPFDPGRPIDLEELFQRELNELRVEVDIVPYLRSDVRLKFFNALTVVLLPVDPDNRHRLAQLYPIAEDLAPTPSRGDLVSTQVGPVLISHQDGDDSVGLLTWSTDLTVPVVLDGQHRFWAIKTIMNETGGRLRDQLSESYVSVLFLVLDERVGFKPGAEMTVLGACREIFIDLNKHAQTVPTARLYLLDDRDLAAVAMRSILAPGLDISAGSVPSRIAQTGRLPLAMVDWRSESAKFESGPHITSVLALHDIVKDVADVPNYAPDRYDEARAVVERIEARFNLEDVAGFNKTAIRADIDAAEAEERPFEIPRDAIKTAGEAFRSSLGRRITEPLVHLAPYAALIGAMTAAGVLGTELEPWVSFNDRERRALLAELGAEDPAPKVAAAWREVKVERYPLAFQVVFQKAFLYSLHSMIDWSDHVWKRWQLEGIPSVDEFITTWIERFNSTVAPALGTTRRASAFYGAGIRFDETIDFRKTKIRVTTGFVSYCMIAPVSEWVQRARANSPVPTADIEKWLVDSWSEIRPGPRSPIAGLLSEHGKNWRNSVDELIGAVLDDEAIEMDQQQREQERLRHGVLQLSRIVEAAAAA
jgi:DNA-sulfur modification-associated